MSNAFLNGMKTATNYTLTENGAVTHKSTMNALLDLFAMGAAYRTRSDEDVILLFKKAFDENPVYALNKYNEIINRELTRKLQTVN